MRAPKGSSLFAMTNGFRRRQSRKRRRVEGLGVMLLVAS